MKILKLILLLIIVLTSLSCRSADKYHLQSPPDVPPDNEVVMSDGMTITVKPGSRIHPPEYQLESIKITATKGRMRSYTWEGETRSVIMWARGARWFGSMGIYYPGPGYHWKKHNGIRRGVLEEGQRHFDTVESALKWLKWKSSCIYRDDGLVVCHSKYLEKLNVDIWQIYIGGKVPSKFQESAIDSINSMHKWPEDIKNIYKATCYVGGHKPTKLPGSKNDLIAVEYLSGNDEESSNKVAPPDRGPGGRSR